MRWDFLFIGVSIAAMIFARRWKNKDSNAGYSIGGWGLTFYIVYIVATTQA